MLPKKPDTCWVSNSCTIIQSEALNFKLWWCLKLFFSQQIRIVLEWRSLRRRILAVAFVWKIEMETELKGDISFKKKFLRRVHWWGPVLILNPSRWVVLKTCAAANAGRTYDDNRLRMQLLQDSRGATLLLSVTQLVSRIFTQFNNQFGFYFRMTSLSYESS